MTFKIDVSTHAQVDDKFIRLTTDLGTVFIPVYEWTYALANPGQCSASCCPAEPETVDLSMWDDV